jgi:antitoxin component YwqK of YwqJK toxin-antitoxin module
LHIQARSNTHAWVRDGLKNGEQVVVYPNGNLRDGARVTLRQVR